MKKLNLSMELLLVTLSTIPLLLTIIFINQLPDSVPIHWNLEGKVDGYGSPWLTPCLCIGLYLLFVAFMFIDPKKENYESFRNLFYKLRLVLTLFFTTLSTIIIYIGLGYSIDLERSLLIGIPLLFAFIGNLLISIKPNWYMGVRTPWTLSSENVWRKTHRLTGKLWFIGGLLLTAVGFLVSSTAGFVILLITIALLSLIPIVYSYIVYRIEHKVINKSGSIEEKK